jgi:hypothetical protein
MRIVFATRILFAIPLLLGVLATPAGAQQPPFLPLPKQPPSALDPRPWVELLGKYFTEDDVRLIFDYLGESALSTLRGEEAPLPPELALKLEILKRRLEKEGAVSSEALIQWLDKELQRGLKQLAPPPPKSDKT